MAISNLTNVGLKNFCRTNAYQKMTDFAFSNITPAEQKLLLGITGVVMQPWIDLRNKNADKETRIYSACKNASKAFVGTVTGFTIRKGCIKFVDYMISKGKMLPNKLSGMQHSDRRVKLFGSAMGTSIAIVIMLFTNFLIDAPLTHLLASKIRSKAMGKVDKQ